MKWSIVKQQVIQELDSHEITCPQFRSKFLNFRRRINTCLNMIYGKGNSWDYVSMSKPRSEADDILSDIKENHKADWIKLTGDTISDDCSSPNVGDFLA